MPTSNVPSRSNSTWSKRGTAALYGCRRAASPRHAHTASGSRSGTARYSCSGGVAEGFDSTIVALVAEDGTAGFGEAAPLGAFYAPDFPAGVRAGVRELLPLVIGADADVTSRAAPTPRRRDDGSAGREVRDRHGSLRPRGPARGRRRWRRRSAGATARPSSCTARSSASRPPRWPRARAATPRTGIGASRSRSAPIRSRTPRGCAPCARPSGPATALVCDANGSWGSAAALRFLQATTRPRLRARAALCARSTSARSCARAASARSRSTSRSSISRRCSPPGRLAGCDAVTIKLARVGGVTRAALLRDVACELGLLVTVEDTGGSDIATAAMAHVSLSTPARSRLHTVDFNAWVTVSNAAGMPAAQGRARWAYRPARASASTVDERELGATARLDLASG